MTRSCITGLLTSIEASWQILARADAFIALSMDEEKRINVEGRIDDPNGSVVIVADAINILACCDGIEARKGVAKEVPGGAAVQRLARL